MKTSKISKIFFYCCCLLLIACNTAPRYKNASLPLEDRIEDLMRHMTLEEKAAQLDMLSANDILEKANILDEEKVKRFIDSMNIGSIHDFYPKSATLANELQRHAVEKSRLGIPILLVEEGLHGYSGPGSTIFPVPLANAATWDTALLYRIGRVIATEARSHGVHMLLSPNLDLAREIRWGRVEETFGEDTYLSSRMAVNIINGMQGNSLKDNNTIASEPKHFGIHGIPEGGSNTGPVFIGEREARSTHLYIFEKAVREAHARGIMAAYHDIDGVPCAGNEWLLTGLLRNEWGFNGMVISDLGAIRRLIDPHFTVETPKEAVTSAIHAGLDMQFYDFPHHVFQNSVVESVREGSLSMEKLNRAVAAVLRIKFELGLFENPYTDTALVRKNLHTKEHEELALNAARQSVILLQNNDHILPVKKNVKKITLAGTLSSAAHPGGYSGRAPHSVSVYEALKERFGNDVMIDYVNTEVSDRMMRIPASVLSTSSSPDVNDNKLKVEFFNNPELEGEAVFKDFSGNLNEYWHNLSPAPGINPDNFSVRWSGFLSVPATGMYEFMFRADDYGRIYIDNKLFIDNWNDNSKNEYTRKQIYLKSGQKIPFRIHYAEISDNAGIWLRWRLVDIASSALPDKTTRSAASSDITIVVMGETAEEVGESRDRQDLKPRDFDMAILEAAAKSGKPVVTVMLTGRPLVLTKVAEYSHALVQAFFLGEMSGYAIVDALFGNINPSGKLAISIPKYHGQLPVYYSRKASSRRSYVDGDNNPLFPFGHGLSYTDFEYSNVKIEPVNPSITDRITVSLNIKNTGKVDGTETVQLYVNDVISSVATPMIALKGFSKVYLRAGETKQVVMTLTPEHLSLINKDMKRVVEPGTFEIMIGKSSADIQYKTVITVK